MAGYQSVITSKINKMRGTPGLKLLQRNYYDRIIRNEGELQRIREYIVNNPLKWKEDKLNPINSQIEYKPKLTDPGGER